MPVADLLNQEITNDIQVSLKMPIPDYQDCMLPLLELLADGKDYTLRAVTTALADRFGLTEDERKEMLPSGQQTVITNRVAWAKTYLKKAGLLTQPGRGVVRISDAGRAVLDKKLGKIDNDFLRQYPSFAEFVGRTDLEQVAEQPPKTVTPEESLESSYQTLRNALADELLEKVKSCTPAFFERLVVEVLVAMGYGGSLADAGQAVGRSGDGGIDGIIKEDKLGLDVLCIQAKRWEKTVGRPEVQAFAGSMEGFRARKGVMLTTSTFSREAAEYVQRIERKIVLIDGRQLAELMIEHGVGVATARTFVLKKLDLDYFEDDEG
ncbi:restriction endonuclease [Frigoriglobus tundricola]|uniref:restriction endonuclease n=1 Tax=Frigoriglobus tundricola TaxID=2774151 RepID=UPI001D060B6F|nr:restriction endonuclease [Frigoriglobus tundricola]